MSNMQRINKANKLHSQLQKTTNVEDRIKLHQAAIKMIEGRENEDPDDGDIVQRNNEFGGIQSIPLLSTNSRGPTLSSFEPSTTEGGITSSTSTESLHHQRRVRRHSVSSESSTSSTGRSRKTASRNASLSRIPAIPRERLTPDAEKRVFNYNYRGPIPTKHHCQRSLFGKHVDVTPEPVETPKRRSQSKNRTPLRQNSEIPRYDHRPGMHLHESSCDAARKLQASKSSTNVSSIPWNFDLRKTPPRVNKGSHENLFQSSAKRRLDAWQPIERSKSSHSVKPITSSTPKKYTEEDSDGYAIPSVSEPDPTLLKKTPIRREVTPPELYQTPAVNLNPEGSGNDSFESAKEFQTPIKKNIRRSGSVLPKESLQDEIEAEIAAIDTVLAKVSPARSKIPKFIPRSINLTPSTDYRNLKDTSVEKNFEEVQAAIKSKSKDKINSSAIQSGSKDKAAGDITSSVVSTSPAVISKSPATTQNDSTLNANVAPMSTTVDDIQALRLFPRYNFDTPKTSKITDKNGTELTPNTKFRTSLTRETLIKSFKEALDINIIAKKRFLKYERQYYEKIRDWKKIERIEKELEKFPNVVKKAMENVKIVTQDYTEKAWRKVLSETEKLQNDAAEFVKLTNENKEKRRRKSLNFGLLGNIDANEFERKHFENLSRRHENAVRLSEAVKKVNIERAIVELQERKAIKDLVRLSLDNKVIAALSQSTSVTESTLTRRSVTLTSTEIRKLAEDAMSNKRKLGKVVSKPELPFIEQESENIISERKSLSSGAGVILSSRHHARIIETQITDMLFVSDNFIPIPPQSGIPSATSSVVPRLDFSTFEDSGSNKLIEPVANVEQSKALEDIVIPDVDTEIISQPKQELKESSNNKSERSDGRTSRDVSSISEFEPPPASVERTSNDDKKTENDASTIQDIEESVHDDDSTLTQNSTSNHAEPKPIENLPTPTEASIFSELPPSHSHDDLQSLPEPLSAKEDESESKHENKEEEIKETLPVIEHPNADSDPERLPLSATTAGTFNASPISSSRLLGDSPIPSPPFVQPSVSSAPEKEVETIKPNVSEDRLAEDEKSVSEASNLQISLKSSSTSTDSSRVVVPSSLENSVHEAPKPAVSVYVEHDEKSTTSISTESSTTTSVASTVSKTTSSKSSSASKDKSKPDSAKSSVETSVAEDLPSTAQSATSSDFSSFLPLNQENNLQTAKKNTVAADNKLIQNSPADEVSEYSFSFSGNSQTNDQQKTAYNRRKSWDMVETGIIGKQSPSYLKNDTIDNDISGIFNNEPPKFESAPSPLGPYAAVSPRSPRSEQHSRRPSFSKSPPLPKHSASKASTDNFEKFLLDDVSLSNIAGPIFDISGGSERGSLSSKDEKNLLDWSPGLSKELSQPKVSKVVEKIEKDEEPKSAPITDDTSISTEIGEPPIDRSVEYNVKEIEVFCREIWPQIEASMQSGDFDSMIPPVINSEDSEKHYHDAYRRLIAASLFSEVQSTLKKGIRYSTFEKFKNRMIEALLNKLSIERKNDLLDGRHIWVQKNNAFMKLVQARQEAQDYDSELVNDYKRELICKAIAAEDIINYSNERANRFTDIGYNECVEFLRKHAPEQLDSLLQQYE